MFNLEQRIKDKIEEIKQYLDEFGSIMPSSIEEYEKDLKEKAACERYVEKIVEAVVDAAFLIIKYKKYEIPDDDKNAFDILKKNKIITDNVCNAMKSAKGMRNLITHQYGKVDDNIVFESITNELVRDVKLFVKEANNMCYIQFFLLL